MFVECQHLRRKISKLETIFRKMGFNTKLTYKMLIFGYKATQEAFQPFINFISQMSTSIYKYWLHNNKNADDDRWILAQ